jgi:hypothetical protein
MLWPSGKSNQTVSDGYLPRPPPHFASWTKAHFPNFSPPNPINPRFGMQNQHIAPPPHMRSLSNYYFRFQVFVGAAVYGCYKESFSQAALVAAASRSLPGQRPPQISSSAPIRIWRLTFTAIAVLFERQRSDK